MKVVLDANVLISAAIANGASNRILLAWLDHEPFQLLLCPRLLDEVSEVLTTRPRLRKWISPDAAQTYIEHLATLAGTLPDPGPGHPITRDPDDDYVVWFARQHAADFIVSGDADLLEWEEQKPRVIPPAQFEAILDRSGSE